MTLMSGTTVTNGTAVSRPPFVVSNGDTFFTFSYGGGVKALRMWGPVGLRADLRGRTLPNFYGHKSVNYPEATGGLTFSWGEK